MLVLGIESSCDDTGVAIYSSEKGLITHALASQIDIHAQFGGVVPELASRNHLMSLIPLVDKVLHEANIDKNQINLIAYTAGPGLIGALLTGACFAKTLAMALNIPALSVHHLEAHILAAKLDTPTLEFPFVVLLVSGGHTQLLLARKLGDYELLGETLDDAAGEAFDKTAKLMGIAYPGGPELAKLADQCVTANIVPKFPRPMTDRPGLDFSFSGLKTHALTTWNKMPHTVETKVAIASAFQEAVVDTLIIKSMRALEQTGVKRLVVAGGVSANLALRTKISKMMLQRKGEVYFPRLEYCTDNGAMIAYAGWLYANQGQKDVDLSINVKARWPL
jgi:N6-L-threonylcarbamoyladenine synthase